MTKVIGVRFRRAGKIYYFSPGKLKIDTGDHVIVETVKPMEKNGKGFIVRLYEAEGATGRVTLTFGFPVKGLVLTNMLEEAQTEYVPAQQLELEFGALEIKTLMICY